MCKIEKKKKTKKSKNMFVLVERTPEDYNIFGIFKSLEMAIQKVNEELEEKSELMQIDEIAINSLLKYDSKQDSNIQNIIQGAVNSYDLEGNSLND